MGTLMALPVLEAMSPALRALEDTRQYPKRVAFIYIPNGANMADWTPKAVGTDFELPMILEPLKPVQSHIQVLSGLAHDKARPHGDGPGDHARASASFLTGCQARKTAGADIKVGVSVDQIAADRLGRFTRLPSLELSCDKKRMSGECDSGYSCAYQYNLSWKTESTPMPPEVDPRQVFERLFSDSASGLSREARAVRVQNRISVLDYVAEDAKRLKRGLGANDQRKLEEYLAAVREVETRVEQSEKFAAAMPDFAMPTDAPQNKEQHIRLMLDLLALAFQTDSTRISTFIIAHDGDNQSYRSIGISEGHHDLSHHGHDETKMQKIAKINQFHASQLAYFLQKLKSVEEGNRTLLDQCMIVYGAAIGDGNAHNHDNLPILLAGGGGGTLQPGRHVRLERETPMTNLYLGMLERLGVPAERVGDSTGKLEDI